MKNSTSFLLPLVVTLFFGCSQKKESDEQTTEIQNDTMELFVGTYTGKGSDGVYTLDFNAANGMLDDKKLVAKTENPSYLALSDDKQNLFVVNENDSGMVSSFQFNSNNNSYEQESQLSTHGAYPCYISLNEEKQLLGVANYMSGNIAVYKVNNGTISGNPEIRQHEGHGPVSDRQEGPHAHCAVFGKKSNFLYAVDLGIDEIKAYPVGADGKIGEGQTAIKVEPGDGPRHLIFHPTKDIAYVVCELSNTVIAMNADFEKGTFESIDRKSTLPDDFSDHSQCADIHITSDGRFLYASNRGHNSIAIFKVAEDGKLEKIGIESVRGDWPRNFVLSPDEKFLIVANQNSNNIVVFEIDQQTGLLKYSGNQVELSSPVCLKF